MAVIFTTDFIRRGLDLRRYTDARLGEVNSSDPDLSLPFDGGRLRLLGDYDFDAGTATGTISELRLETMMTIDGVAGRHAFLRITGLALDAGELLSDLQGATMGEILATLLSGDDRMTGSHWRDRLDGMLGNDTLFGGDGIDTIIGGAGRDLLSGGDDGDVLFGGTGNDRLSGDYGKDRLFGGAGADILLGGGGDDRLEGGAGNDTLAGLAGEDVLIFRGDFGRDSIRQMTAADSIVLGDGFFTGGRTAADLVADHARVLSGGILLDLGANEIFVGGITDTDLLAARLRSWSEFFGA